MNHPHPTLGLARSPLSQKERGRGRGDWERYKN